MPHYIPVSNGHAIDPPTDLLPPPNPNMFNTGSAVAVNKTSYTVDVDSAHEARRNNYPSPLRSRNGNMLQADTAVDAPLK